MIDDALTSTRTSQRLLLAAAAVTLVFVLSLADVREERQLLKDVRRLLALPVDNYAGFVNERISAELAPVFQKSAERFGRDLDQQIAKAGLKIFGAGLISAAFQGPAHVGRLRPEDLASPSTVSLERLDQIYAALPLDQDVQVVQVDPSGLIPRIVGFLAQETPEGTLGPTIASIANVQVHLVDEPSGIVDSFLSPQEKEPEVLLTLELRRSSGLTPIFEGHFRGSMKTLPESSYRDWLAKADGGDLLRFVAKKPRWLSSQSLDPTLRKVTLQKLAEGLSKEVEAATAKNRTISLPGIEIPGSLALFTIPIVLLGLGLSFLEHVRHLRRLAPDHRETFKQFAWTPLMQRDPWYGEIFVSALLLPALAQALLAWRFDAFDLPAWVVVTLGVMGALGNVLIGHKILKNLASLRRATWQPSTPAPETPKPNG